MWNVSLPPDEVVSMFSVRLRHATSLERVDRLDEMLERAAEAVEFPDDEAVPCPEVFQRLSESKAVGARAEEVIRSSSTMR